MRSDMGRVVIERPRRKGLDLKYKSQRRRSNQVVRTSNPDDDFDNKHSNHEGLKKPYINNQKQLSDLLGTIKRYLHSRVGQNWDKVWSDVCTNLKGTVAVEHVREHVLQVVAKIGPVNKYHNVQQFGPIEAIKFGRYFYVDASNVLQKQIPEPKLKYDYKKIGTLHIKKLSTDDFYQLESPKETIPNYRLYIKDKIEYIYLDNSWYKFAYKHLSEFLVTAKQYCEDTHWRFSYPEYDVFGNKSMIHQSINAMVDRLVRYKMIQLNHKELKQLGLQNYMDE